MNLKPALTMLLAAASLAAGGDGAGDRYSWLQAQGGYLRQENSFCVKDTTALGLGGGDWLSRRWGWEGSWLTDRLEDTAHLWKARESHFDASVLHSPFGQLGDWRPFLRGGVGFSDLAAPASLSSGSTQRLNLLGGVGTQFLFKEQGLASLEARYVNVRTSAARSEYQLLAGVGLRWGCSAPVPRVAPMPDLKPLPAPVAAAPAPAPVVPDPAPVVVPPASAPAPTTAPAPLPAKIVLGDAVLHFANNGADLSPEGTEAVKAVAAQLKAYQGAYTLMVSGHTSSLGSTAHNHALSKRRAEAVARLLVGAGIPEDRVFTVGQGPDAPIADNKTREGQSRNRRVEIDVKTMEAVEKVHKDTGLVDGPAQTKAPAKKRSRP